MITQLNLFNDDGEVISKITMRGSPLGKDWFVMYEEGVRLLISQAPDFITMKVYLQLSTMQSYDTYIITNIKHLSKVLKVSYVSVWKSIKWLKKNNYIEQKMVNGQTAFVLNPSVANKGRKSLKEKVKIFGNKPTIKHFNFQE